eukprot:scaffold4136_cov101-Isochrysis_galbana.AAC.10
MSSWPAAFTLRSSRASRRASARGYIYDLLLVVSSRPNYAYADSVLVLGLVLVLMDCTKLPALSTSAAMILPSADGTSVWRRKGGGGEASR